MIRKVKIEDLNQLSVIYRDLFNDANIGENWSIENARFYEKCTLVK